MPEFRKDPVTGRWVIIATDRAIRPTDFARDPGTAPRFHQAPYCPFCPGNESKTPPSILEYTENGAWCLRVVSNKFPALGIEGELAPESDGLYERMNGVGAHEVVVESPNHGKALADLLPGEVSRVFASFRDRIADLKGDSRFRCIVVFKNHGEAAGASLEHSHSQLIALPVVPKRVREGLEGSRAYWAANARCVYCDIVQRELASGARLVAESDRFVVLSPYASRFAFETWIVPKRHASNYEGVSEEELAALGGTVKDALRRMNAVLDDPPYNLMIHSAPLADGGLEHYHWHIELIPRLSQVAGFEWGSGFFINPMPPEEAARLLRAAAE